MPGIPFPQRRSAIRRLRACKIMQFARSRLLKPYPALTNFLLSVSIRVSSRFAFLSGLPFSFLSASATRPLSIILLRNFYHKNTARPICPVASTLLRGSSFFPPVCAILAHNVSPFLNCSCRFRNYFYSYCLSSFISSILIHTWDFPRAFLPRFNFLRFIGWPLNEKVKRKSALHSRPNYPISFALLSISLAV